MKYFTSIKKGVNKKGKIFCIGTYDNEKHTVYTLCENYDGNVRGGISKSWRCVVQNVSLEEAEVVFKRRTK